MGTFDKTTQELARLKAVTRPRSQSGDDLKLQLAAMVGGLADLSDEIIGDGCRSWAQQSQWFPTLAELREACIKHQPPPKRAALPRPWTPRPDRRQRAINSYGLRRVRTLMASDAATAEWDALQAEIARYRTGENLPDEIKDAIG